MKQGMVTKRSGGRRVTKNQRMNPVRQEGSADPVQDEYADLAKRLGEATDKFAVTA